LYRVQSSYLIIRFQSGFESTLGGMMDAMIEIQAKGDLMMETIKTQKKVLSNLDMKVKVAEKRLDEANMMADEVEIRWKEAENERMIEVKYMQTFDTKKENLELELKTLEETKALAKQSVESLEVEINRLAPLKTDVTTRTSELSKVEQNIEQKTEELRQVKQKIEVSSKLLK
jgi:chromosome segregation ATPase